MKSSLDGAWLTLSTIMSRIPGALESILHQPPRNSLYLVTDVLAASANWVLLRYLYAVFAREASSRRQRLTGSEHDVDSVPFADHAETSNSDAEGQTAVVFVSWMQDYDFWKTEAKRVVVCSGPVIGYMLLPTMRPRA